MSKLEILNLTPHKITLVSADGDETTIEPSGTVARVSMKPGKKIECLMPDSNLSTLGKIPCDVYDPPTYGEVENLPSFKQGRICIVSMFCAQSMNPGIVAIRGDIYYPGTGPADEPIRDEDGRIIAVTRLIKAKG